MMDRVFAPVCGVLIAALAAGGIATQARAADPSGIWAKDDGTAKMEIKKCGRGICSKIVWLRAPKNSRGKPLRDARNGNPSMRDRPILGLPLFSNMVLTQPNTWVGNVYNPEEGRIYTDVKVTMVSRQQIVLRGCRTWLLCGEKSWTRSKLAPVPAEPEELIEVKAPAEAPIVAASRGPGAGRSAVSTLGSANPAAVSAAKVSDAPKRAKPSTPVLYQHVTIGLGFVVATTSEEPLPLSGENVSSMMVMTRPEPLAAKPQVTPPVVEAALEDSPASTPKPTPKRKTRAAQAAPAPMAAVPAAKPKPKPKPRPVARKPEVLPWLQQ